MTMIAVKARVTGRVQGVAFRAWTQARAEALDLKGWVLNEISGSVLALFEGEKDAVQKMVDELWTGPGAASVQNVQADTVPTGQAGDGFTIRH